MAKTTGLGDNFYVGGFNITGDTASLSSIHGGPAALDFTDITESAIVRLGGLRDGGIDWTSYFNASGAHSQASALPTTDVVCTYFNNTVIGNPAASLVAKELNYDPTRGTDGSLTLAINAQANAFGLEWGKQLTAGLFSTSNFLTTAGQNSGFENGSTSPWTGAGNSSIAASQTQAHTGSWSMAMTSTAGGTIVCASCTAGTITSNGLPCTPGSTVAGFAWMWTATAARTARIDVSFYNSGGSAISVVTGPTMSLTASTWNQVTTNYATAPAASAFCRLIVNITNAAGAGEIYYIDDVSMTATSPSTTINDGASTAFGAQAYLQVTAFSGTDATISIYDSADNSTFAAVAGLAFTQVTSAPFSQRISIANNATLRQYVEPVLTTVGGFNSITYAVMYVRNTTAGVVF